MRSFIFGFVILASVLCLPLLASGAPTEENPCSCTFWEPLKSDEGVASLTVYLEAESAVTADDKYFLKLVDRQDKTVHYVKLTISKEGKGKVVAEFEDLPTADSLYYAVLFSPEKNIPMKYLKVVGDVGGEEHVFFDHGCTGITIGPKGCIWMELH